MFLKIFNYVYNIINKKKIIVKIYNVVFLFNYIMIFKCKFKYM